MKWISVEDDLPPKDTEIIVFAENTFEKVYVTKVCISEDRIETGNKLIDYETYSSAIITHWMPLPKEPEKEYKKLVDRIQLNFKNIIITENDKIIYLLEEFLSNCHKEKIDWKVVSKALTECGDAITLWEKSQKVP